MDHRAGAWRGLPAAQPGPPPPLPPPLPPAGAVPPPGPPWRTPPSELPRPSSLHPPLLPRWIP
eukprot:2142339-Heterocapsa_arctica.AAC.1